IPVNKDHLFVVTGRLAIPPLKPSSTLHCVDLKTGKPVWSKKDVGRYHAALLKTANDKFLMLTDLGDLVLLEPNVKEYKELCRAKIVKGQQIWAHPALSNGKVYLRDDKELICVEVTQ